MCKWMKNIVVQRVELRKKWYVQMDEKYCCLNNTFFSCVSFIFFCISYSKAMAERDFMKKHEERERVDSEGYLEACVGFDEYQLARLPRKILQPKTYINVLGASVLFGRDGIMSGSIERHAQNLLIKSDFTDFSIDALYQLSHTRPKAHYVRRLSDMARFYLIPSKDEYGNHIVKGKAVLKWKINRNTMEMIVQFGKLPCSRSDFSVILSGITKTVDWDTASAIREILHKIDDDIYPMESSDWYHQFLGNLKKLSQDNTITFEDYKIIEKFLETYAIEKESTLYAFPLMKLKKGTKYIDANNIPISESLGVFGDAKQWSYGSLKFDIIETEDLQVSFQSKSVIFTCNYSIFKFEAKENTLNEEELYKIKGNAKILYQEGQAEFETTLDKKFKIDVAKVYPNNNIMRTYLSSIIRQTKIQFMQLNDNYEIEPNLDTQKLKTVVVKPSETPADLNLGFVYTTDEGIQTGVPFTAYKNTYCFKLPQYEAVVKNLSDRIMYFNLDDIMKFYEDESYDESHGRYIIPLFLNKMLKMLESSANNFEYVIFYSSTKNDNIVKLRCQLMAVLKVFPVCHKQNDLLERTKLFKADVDFIEVFPEKCIINGTNALFHNMTSKILPKAFEDAESLHRALNEAKIKDDEKRVDLLDKFFKETEGPGDVTLEMKSDKLLCKALDNTISWTAETIFEVEYVPNGKKRARRKFYKNQLKSFEWIQNEDEDGGDIDSFYKLALNIPFKFTKDDGETEEKFIANYKFNHPLTLVCPYKSVYRCTESPGKFDVLMRPFPSEVDLKSMIDFCELKGHLLFKTYE